MTSTLDSSGELGFAADRRGVTMLEYGLIAGIVSIAIVTGLTVVGSGLNTVFSGIVPYFSNF